MGIKKPFVVGVTESYHKNIVVWAVDSQEARSIADGLCSCGVVQFKGSDYAGRIVESVDHASTDDMKYYRVYE